MPRVATARFGAVIAAPAVALLAVALLAGCSGSQAPASTHAATSAPAPSATPSSAATPAAPQFYPDGTAKGNKAYFDSVNTALSAAHPSPNGEEIINSLVAAGFDKTNMQLTPDKTTIGRAVDSVLFSVRIGTECLLGQFSGSEYTSSVQAALTNGTCLVGKTRPITW
jgi:hypothetical protein